MSDPDVAESTAGDAREIQAIDKASVHRICSGQVVLNLATAIKELVENSLDAGATSIEVRLRDHGSELVEVVDNGSGVEEKNFAGLTLKHHTSKLKDFSDLVNVDTFGFRGEALSSLCALSKLTIVTCHENVSVGSRIEYNHNGKIVQQSKCARQKGTTVILENLFSTLPVRHKEFLRNIKREFSKAVQVLNAYCMISTGVRITCTNQVGKGKKNIVVNTAGNSNTRENITNIFGAKQVQSLLAFAQISPDDDVCTEYNIKGPKTDNKIFTISGYLSSSEHGQGRSATDRQYYFINQRPCDPQKVSRLVNEVYHMYNRHQYPFVMLDISLAKTSVDVNVTPDKRQIFIQEERTLLAIIKSSLMKMFEPKSSLYRINQFSKPSSVTNSFSKSPLKSQMSSPDKNKKTLTSTLASLKRSFSSAFAKDIEETDIEPTKQRKLDNFFAVKASQGHEVKSPNRLRNGHASPETPLEQKIRINQLQESVKGSQSSDDCVIAGETVFVKDESVTDSQSSGIGSSSTDVLVNISSTDVLDNIKEVGTACQQEKERESAIETSYQQSDLSSSVIAITSPDTNSNIQDDAEKNSMLNFELESSSPTDSVEQIHESFTSQSVQDQTLQPEKLKSISTCKKTEHNQIVFTEYDNAKSNRPIREQHVPFSFASLSKKVKSHTQNHRDKSKLCRNFRAQINPSDNTAAEEELQREISKDMFEKMEILGQFNLGFIIVRLGRDLFIIDQHATDEKYNFETLQRETVIHGQRLIHPQSLELTAANECILMDNVDIFRHNGFEFMIDEDAPPTQRVKLVTMPVSKNWTFGKDDIEELIFMLTDSPGVLCRPSRVRQMFASRACRKSIMIGTALNKAEMKKLVTHMAEIEQPWNCPHGRPTMRHLINLDMLPD